MDWSVMLILAGVGLYLLGCGFTFEYYMTYRRWRERPPFDPGESEVVAFLLAVVCPVTATLIVISHVGRWAVIRVLGKP